MEETLENCRQAALSWGFRRKDPRKPDLLIQYFYELGIVLTTAKDAIFVTAKTPHNKWVWYHTVDQKGRYCHNNEEANHTISSLKELEEMFGHWLRRTFRLGSALLRTIAINVPGSLLQQNPPILRKDDLKAKWKASAISKIAYLTFLDNPCTPAEIVTNPEYLELAKRHDTFYPPPLLKYLMKKDSLTEEEKAGATILAESEILRNWNFLITTLTGLGFSCQDPAAVAHYDSSQLSGQPLVWMLDALRTKLTRTACTLSHLRLYRDFDREMSEIEYPFAGLLLEDDLVFAPGLDKQIIDIVHWLQRNDSDWNFVQLGWSKHADRPVVEIPGSPLSRPVRGVFGNTAVLVNLGNGSQKKLAKLIQAAQLATPVLANDVILAEGCDREHCYVATQRLVGPPVGQHLSVLAGKAMDYSSVCWDPEVLELISKSN
jgi:hypothetical protein